MLDDNVWKEYLQLPISIWDTCKVHSTSISISFLMLCFIQATQQTFQKIIRENFQKFMFDAVVTFCKLCSVFKTGGFLLPVAKSAEHKHKIIKILRVLSFT